MLFVPHWAGEFPETEAREDCGTEGNTEEDCHTFRYCGVGDADLAVGVTDNFDEEDCEGCVEDHLENGVDGNEDGAVFIIPACETGPDENLFS